MSTDTKEVVKLKTKYSKEYSGIQEATLTFTYKGIGNDVAALEIAIKQALAGIHGKKN